VVWRSRRCTSCAIKALICRVLSSLSRFWFEHTTHIVDNHLLDRRLEDVFAVQDEVARTIVSVLAVHVNKAETERVLATPPTTWQAYEHYLQAADTLISYHTSLDKGHIRRP
jgi:hypothetical protein